MTLRMFMTLTMFMTLKIFSTLRMFMILRMYSECLSPLKMFVTLRMFMTLRIFVTVLFMTLRMLMTVRMFMSKNVYDRKNVDDDDTKNVYCRLKCLSQLGMFMTLCLLADNNNGGPFACASPDFDPQISAGDGSPLFLPARPCNVCPTIFWSESVSRLLHACHEKVRCARPGCEEGLLSLPKQLPTLDPCAII